jgi:hypothetical protein
MGVLEPSGNGLYLLPLQQELTPKAPPRGKRVKPVPMFPSLPIATPYCGTAGLHTLICKAYMPSIPTVSPLAQHEPAL